jgi:uncharacterized membrane protein SpoIIM required for sporulation
MDEKEFVRSRQETWQRLTQILQKAGVGGNLRALQREEVRTLGPLYRRAAADLAYARAHAASPTLVKHLNDLVARTYALLYQTDKRQWGGMLRFLTHDFPDTFRRRLSFFLVTAGFLVAGALIGYILVHLNRDNIYIFIPPGSDFSASLDAWEKGEVAHNATDSHNAIYASFLMQNNIRVSFIAFAGGILGGIFTAYIMFLNGAMVGALTGVITHAHQHHNYWPGILPHGVVELSETCIAGAAGLSLAWALLAPGPYRRKDAVVLAARDSVKLVIGGVLLLIFAGFVEGFISHSLLPKPFKVTFGIVSGIALYGYLFLSGRSKAKTEASEK